MGKSVSRGFTNAGRGPIILVLINTRQETVMQTFYYKNEHKKVKVMILSKTADVAIEHLTADGKPYDEELHYDLPIDSPKLWKFIDGLIAGNFVRQ